ncbi:MAG: thioredoxin [Caldilineaceae bacterium]|nr:thioredoxin [Caldilineaceae bacterium]MCB0141982.1 thioredoxin [Caldilineaceae bacterium]
MGNAITITDATFEEQVINSDTPVLVDFWAEWCGPCKMIAPVLDEIATELNGKLTIGKINVDEEQSTMMAYGIMGIPALLLFKDGELVTRITGFRPKPQLMAELTPHIN